MIIINFGVNPVIYFVFQADFRKVLLAWAKSVSRAATSSISSAESTAHELDVPSTSDRTHDGTTSRHKTLNAAPIGKDSVIDIALSSAQAAPISA